MESNKKLKATFDQIESRRKKLFALLDRYHSSDLKIKESDTQWSVNQVLTHLVEAENGTVAYIKKKMMAPELLTQKTGKTSLRFALLKVALALPVKYKLPQKLPVPSNEFEYIELKMSYDQARSKVLELIDNLPGALHEKEIFRHPFAGRFTLRQTLGFLGDHMEHHERQIQRILSNFKTQ